MSQDLLNRSDSKEPQIPELVLALLLASAAGGLGWGIRGQYGHETGAMMAGLLVGLACCLVFCGRLSSLTLARAAAMGAIGFSFGGTMTIGQTIGLTHDHELVGQVAPLMWGMLGLFIKGGIWIGFGGLLLAMGLGGKKYGSGEIAILFLVMMGVGVAGYFLLNQPYDPANRELPLIYFSDHWRWEPDKELKPRHEQWGGLLFALITLAVYTGWIKKDRLARNMAICSFLSGGLGWMAGQGLQSAIVWNREWFQESWLRVVANTNTWNTMETAFGMAFGLGIGLSLWLNRHLIATDDREQSDEPIFSPWVEWLTILLHIALLIAWNFDENETVGRVVSFFGLKSSTVEQITDFPFVMGILPLAAIVAGRYWPYAMSFIIVAIPIAGKTYRIFGAGENPIPDDIRWFAFVVYPIALMVGAAYHFWFRSLEQTGRSFTAQALVLTSFFYYSLNFAFFGFPWPWAESGARSPNNWVFNGCVLTIVVSAIIWGHRKR